MDSPVEYRPGLFKSFILIFPGVFCLGLTIYLLQSGPLPTATKQLPGLIMCGVADLAMLALLCYGVAVLRFSRLSFYSDGFTYQDVGISPLRMRWKDVDGVSIQDASSQGTSSYRVVVKLKNQALFLKGLPEKTKRNLGKQSGYLAEGIPIHTQNIQITLAQLRQEFGNRTSVSSISPGDQIPWSDAQVAPDPRAWRTVPKVDASAAQPTSIQKKLAGTTRGLQDGSTQVFRPTPARLATMIGILLALLGLSVFLLLSTSEDPAKEVMMRIYGGVVGVLTLALAGTGLVSNLRVRLALEPEGFVYTGQNAQEVRIRWEEVAGVHVAEVGREANLILMVDLKDYNSYLRSLDADSRRKQESRRARLGDGIPINVQMVGLTPEAAARLILSRAGLS